MQRPRSLWLLALLGIALAAPAAAQWKWRDQDGRVQYSDRPPPSGTPEQSILEKPRTAVVSGAAAAAATAATAASSAGVTAVPAARQVDPELEARRKKVVQEEAAKKKQDDDRQVAARAENCTRARGQLRTLEDGGRLRRTNAQGEPEVLDDAGRAQEVARARAVISADCR